MRDLIERYRIDREDLDAFYDLPLSEVGPERRQAHLAEWQTRLEAVDYDSLDADDRIDFLAFRNYLSRERSRVARRARWAEEERELLGFAEPLLTLEGIRRRVEPLAVEQACRGLAEAAEAADALKARLLARPEPEVETPEPIRPDLALRAAEGCEALLGVLREWYRHYADYKPDFAWWCRQPFESLEKTIARCGRILRRRGEADGALAGTPVGAEEIASDLRHEMLAYSAEELLEIGEREVAWCERELRNASQEMGCGDDWRAALEKVKASHVPVGEQDALIAQQVREAIGYVEDNDLVTLEPLCKELWRLDMLSEESQRMLPYQGYGGLKVLVSYPTHGMGLAARRASMRANNLHFSRAVTQHEMIPGHHLQIYMAHRYRPYRQLMGTPFLLEGWCLYWEMLLWDRGFPRGPEDRIGMLFWRTHRCARIVVSLKFHRGEMTPAEMVDYLIDHVGHERDAATSEVRRYIGSGYPPLYQCAYMIGGLQIRALYRELVDSGRMSPRAFHDAVLRENSLPIELIRARLTGTELGRDFHPTWRFAD